MPSQAEANRMALDRTRQLVPLAREQAVVVEAAGTLSGTMIDALREAGLFWMMVPQDLGGGGADIFTGLQCVEQMSRADGSIGWTLMANSTAVTNAAGFLPAATVERMFAGGLPIVAGMLAPRGSAVPTGDGFTISGDYQFGSGIAHADWVAGGVFVRDDGHVRVTAAGGPDISAFYVPRSHVELKGNWDVMGLNGSGSFDYHIPEQYVEASFGYSIAEARPTRAEPSYQLGFIPLGSLGHGAIGLGIALRAVEEMAAIAHAKRRPGNPGISAQPLFLHDFAEKEASLQAARCLYFDAVRAALLSAERTGSTSPAEQVRMIQANTHATVVAADVVRWCYTWSGSDGLRHPSALGRCLRDMAGATQHVLVDPNTLVGIAPGLLAEVGDPVRAAAALLEIVDANDPPLRILLGAMACDAAPRIYDRRLEEWRRWDRLGRSTDHPSDRTTGDRSRAGGFLVSATVGHPDTEVRRFLHSNYNCRIEDLETLQRWYADLFALKPLMRTTGDDYNAEPFGVRWKTTNDTIFLYDHSGARRTTSLELVGWIDPPAVGTPYTNTWDHGIQASATWSTTSTGSPSAPRPTAVASSRASRALCCCVIPSASTSRSTAPAPSSTRPTTCACRCSIANGRWTGTPTSG